MADDIDNSYDDLFQQTGQKYGIDPLLLKAQAQYESGMDPAFKNTTSSASGLTAFTNAAAQDYNVDRSNPASSIDGQARYLINNYKKAKDPTLALSMYKTGPGISAVDNKYVDGVTGIYQKLKQKAQGQKPQMDDLDPQDDFERAALGKEQMAGATDIYPQDYFEKALLAEQKAEELPDAPKDAFEQQAVAPVKITQSQKESTDLQDRYKQVLENARSAMQPTGASPSTGVGAQELGYAANALHQLPGLSELGSGLAATAQNLTSPSKIPETYNQLELAQQAMRQAGKEANPGATALGEVGTALATAPALPAAGTGATSSLGKILGGAATGGGYGALYGLGQGDATLPTEQATYGRLGNAATSGVAGTLLGGAVPAAIEAGRGTANIFSGKGMSPEVAQLAKTAADNYGVKIPGGLLSDSPIVNRAYSMLDRLGLTGSSDNAANFTKAVSNTFGEDTPKLTRAAMDKAADNIGSMYDDVRSKTPQIKISNNLLTKLGDAEAMAEQTLPSGDSRIKNQITNLLSVASKNNGTIPVETWQSLVGSKSALTKLSKAGLDPAAGPAQDIKGALYDALGESAPPEAQALFNRANTYYKNFKTVQQKGLDPVTGEFSPTALASNVTRTSKKYGTSGLGTLQELGDVGKQFSLTPSSGTAENYLLAKSLGFGSGGLEAGLAFHDPILAAKIAAGTVATAAGGRAVGAALSSDWYRNMLVNSALKNQGPGALSKFTTGTNYVPALAYGTNRLLQSQQTPPSVNQ